MRTVLVCVRTPLAAQNVAAAAARLGLAAVVRTAVSDPEVMLRLAERPADVVLADTALTRPDSVGFTRRVLARSPGAAILLLGSEDPGVAAATIAAGARGLIQGGDHDLVSVVAKAMLLLGAAGRGGGALPGGASTGRPAVPAGGGLAGAGGAEPGRPSQLGDGAGQPAANQRSGSTLRVPTGPGAGPGAGEPPAGRSPSDGPVAPAGTGPSRAASRPDEPGPPAVADGPDGEPPAGSAVVPAQRGDDVPEAAAEPPGPGGSGPALAGPADGRGNAAPDARFEGPRRGGPVDPGGYGRAEPGGSVPARRPALTEREMQVLFGMADGKSNAEIGRELFVSEDTVKTHARRLFRKLGARDRAHAVAAGFRAGLVA